MFLANTGQNFLAGLVGFLLPFVGIAFVIFLVYEAIKWSKGQASVKQVVIGLLSFVFVGGLMVFANSYFSSVNKSSALSNTVQSVTDHGVSDAGNIAGGKQ